MRRFVVIIATICLLIPTISVFAANESTAIVSIEVDYASDITPQAGDTFVLTYRVKNSVDDATIEFDASTLDGNVGELELPQAEYEIIDILYTGKNRTIAESAYCCTADFTCSAEYSLIELGIGETPSRRITNTYANTVIRVDGESTSSLDWDDIHRNVGDDGNPEGVEYQAEEDKDEESDVSDTETKDPSKEEVEERPEVKTKKSSSPILKIVPLAFIALIGFAVMYVLHKKGKI